jgi:hypothetical protein
MTQSMRAEASARIHGVRSTGPNNGSHDTNRIAAGYCNNNGARRDAHFWFSTVVPNHTLAGQRSPQGTRLPTTSGRLVSSSQSKFGV